MPQLKLIKQVNGRMETVTLHPAHYVHITKIDGRIERVSERYDRTGTTRAKVTEDFRQQGFVHEDELEEQ